VLPLHQAREIIEVLPLSLQQSRSCITSTG